MRESLAAGRFDLGLSFETEPENDDPANASALALARLPLAVFCGTGHALLAGAPREVDRSCLAPYTIFTSDASGDFHALLERFLAPTRPGPRLEAVGSVEAVKRSVEADTLALGVLPAYAVAAEVRQGTLQVLRCARSRHESVSRRAQPHTPRSPATAELLEALRGIVARPERAARLLDS